MFVKVWMDGKVCVGKEREGVGKVISKDALSNQKINSLSPSGVGKASMLVLMQKREKDLEKLSTLWELLHRIMHILLNIFFSFWGKIIIKFII